LRSDGLATDQQPQLAAVREALVNLLMHSDYFSSMQPRIRVFLDRIEFMNPGPLPKDLESIIKEDFSMPRNPIVARIFRAIKLSENAGSGFDKMFTGWKAHYGIEPIVSEGIDFYKIEFPLKEEAEKETIRKESKTKKTRVKTRVKTREKIISLIKDIPEITTNELAQKLNI
jgi:ATP-dependent DNA helicase RecG